MLHGNRFLTLDNANPALDSLFFKTLAWDSRLGFHQDVFQQT